MSLHLRLILSTGIETDIPESAVSALTLEEGVYGGDMLIGSAVSAHWTAVLCGVSLPRVLRGALCLVYREGTVIGRFIITAVRHIDQGAACEIDGYDEMAVRMNAVFSDTASYPRTLSSLLADAAASCGLETDTVPPCNADTVLAKKPAWGKSTCRQVIAFIASAMGAYARITPEGKLSLVSALPQSVPFGLTPDAVTSLSCEPDGFTLAAVRLLPYNDENASPVTACDDAALTLDASNTLTLADNPLFISAQASTRLMALNLLAALKGLSVCPFEAGVLTADLPVAAPVLLPEGRRSMIFSRRTDFGPLPVSTVACALDVSGISLPRILTSACTLSAAAFSDGIITARTIAAGAVDTEKLSARAVTADKLAAGAVTAQSIAAEGISADVIRSGTLDTDRLIVAGSEFSIVKAINQLASQIAEEYQDDTNVLNGSAIKAHSITASKLESGIGGTLDLSANAAMLLLAGKLDGTNSHLELTRDAVSISGGRVSIFGEGALTLTTASDSSATINGGAIWHARNLVVSTAQPPFPRDGTVWIRPDMTELMTGTWQAPALTERPNRYTAYIRLSGTALTGDVPPDAVFTYSVNLPVFNYGPGDHAAVAVYLLPDEDTPLENGIAFGSRVIPGEGSKWYNASSSSAVWLGDRSSLVLAVHTDDRSLTRVNSGNAFSLVCSSTGGGVSPGWKNCTVSYYHADTVSSSALDALRLDAAVLR